MPKVSILIPVFNRVNFIEDCIISAINQTYDDFDIIIVDNCGTDGTIEKINNLLKIIDFDIKFYINDTNLGPVKNWKRCVELSNSEYIKFLFSDDLIMPTFIEKCMPYFNDDQIAFVSSSVLIGPSLDDCKFYYKPFDKDTVIDSLEFINDSLKNFGKNFPVSPGAAIFRRNDALKNIMGNKDFGESHLFDYESTGAGIDWMLFLITAEAYAKVAIINEPLSFFRAHEDSFTIKNHNGNVNKAYSAAAQWFLNKGQNVKIENEFDLFTIIDKKIIFNNSEITIFCAVWSQQKDKEALLLSHYQNITNLNLQTNHIYLFDSSDTPPTWFKGNYIVFKEKTTIYETWCLATHICQSKYLMNLNIDDRLTIDSLNILIEEIKVDDKSLVGGEWLISFEPPVKNLKYHSKKLEETIFSPEWPPSKLENLRLGSGTGERGTFGPATLWNIEKIGKFYPYKFDSGVKIKSIGDSIFWNTLMSRGFKLARTNNIIGVYYSNPNEQAEFRVENEWINNQVFSDPSLHSIKITDSDKIT